MVLDFLGTVEAGELPGGEFVVSANGPLDERIAAAFRDTLMPLTAAAGAPLLLDLANAHGLDAAAMLVIADAAHVVGRRGEQLGIVTRSPLVLRLISESGLDEIVKIATSLTEAIGREDTAPAGGRHADG